MSERSCDVAIVGYGPVGGFSALLLADAGLPMGVMRGFALLARCAGLLGQIAEEIEDPIANDMYMTIDRNTDYQPPPRD